MKLTWGCRKEKGDMFKRCAITVFVATMLMVYFGVHSLQAQYFIDIKSPTQSSPCVDYPVEVVLTNDGGNRLDASVFQLLTTTGFQYINGSVSNVVGESDPDHDDGPIFSIPVIPPCESISFLLWLNHECISEDVEERLRGLWQTDVGDETSPESPIRLFGLQLSLIDIQIYLDSTDFKFKKAYTIVNSGKVALEDFVFFIDGEDNMDILSTSLGTLSANGDTIYFENTDYVNFGNRNMFFEPGESFRVVHEIDLNACEEAFPFVHKMKVQCGSNECEFEVISQSELKVTIGQPRLIVLQQVDQNVTPCDSGVIILKMTNRSMTGSFPQANALYNLDINSGWSFIRNSQRTDPLRDNCLRVVDASVSGTNIPILTQGYTGYGLDFTRITSDPDGPGGLSDIDGDGRFDDLHAGDTICLKLRYVLKSSCLNIRCSGQVFESRIFRMLSEYDNYCDEPIETGNYINRHNYYWSGTGGSIGGLDGIYSDGEKDTLTIRLAKSTAGFLTDCGEDSAIVRITLPVVMNLPNGAIILVNGDTTTYSVTGRRITLSADTNRFLIQIPVELECDPNAGGGTIQTACTFCLGSGLPKYRINVEMDYFCEDDCVGKIPLICFQSPEFITVCDAGAKGIVSEGKFVIDDMQMIRQTLGYEDSTKQNKVISNGDSLDLGTLMTFDTFLLAIPFDIRCDANYSNLRFRLIQNSIIRINQGVRDTSKYFKFLSDTIKYYDAETNRWSNCVNRLGNEYFNTQNDGYRNNYIKEVNLSSQTCLRGNFSSPDSLVIIVRGVVLNEIRNNVQRLNIRGDLTYTQDGCGQNDRSAIQFNAFSGLPNAGSVFLYQPYVRDTSFKRYYNVLSVCGTFELNTYLDNVYYNVDSIDPFQNEFRKPYRIDHVQMIIPDFFELDSLPFNYVEEYYNSPARVLLADTSKLPYSVRDSLSYYVVDFPFDDNTDFRAVRHLLRMNMHPNCYGFVHDTIRVVKKFRVQQQGSGIAARDSIVNQFFPLNIGAIEPIIDNVRQQFLFDSLSVTTFSLNPATGGFEPADYFDFHHTWLILDLASKNISVDSLIECTDSIRKIHQPTILADGRLLYQLDTTYLKREFKLYSHVRSCGPDTIRMSIGTKCDGYPIDWTDVDDVCDRYAQKRVIVILPETPDLVGEFLLMPDSSHASPCDTFDYLLEFRNSNLGHLNDPEVVLDSVDGLVLISAELEYPEGVWQALGSPVVVGKTLHWELATLFDSTGFKGFFSPGLNLLKLRLSFKGGCEIQDGAVIAVEMNGRDLCSELVSSGPVNAIPLFFERDSLSGNEDLYDIDLRFKGDTLCGDTFEMRVVLTSKSADTDVDGQRLGIYYRKELSFAAGSYVPIRNIENDILGLNRFEEWEQIYIDLAGGVPIGDSVVFNAKFERTCIGICKPTDLRFEVLTPKDIGCPTAPMGSCRLLLNSQTWEFSDVIVAPHYQIVDGQGFIERLPSGDERYVATFSVENLSSFGINNQIVVRYYDDVNGNGMLDAQDVLLKLDSIDGALIQAFEKRIVQSELNWPPNASCNLIAVISPSDNPCICLADTVAFPPITILPQSDFVRSCYSNNVTVGFMPIQGYSYNWLDSNLVSDARISETEYTFNGSMSRNSTRLDTLLVVAQRRAGCEVVDTVVVEWYRPLVVAQLVDSIRCHGDATGSLTANMDGGQYPLRYQWNTGDTMSTIENVSSGTYQVVIYDANGCRDTADILVDQPDSLVSQIDLISDYNGFPIKCSGDVNGWIELAVSGGSPDYEYHWLNRISKSNRLDSLSKGWTKFWVEDRYGCRILDSIFLTEPTPLDVMVGATKSGCDDDHLGSAYVTAWGGVGGFDYQWNTTQSGDTINNLQAGEYIVTATDANGCVIYDTVEVEQHVDPRISVNILDTVVEYGKSVRLRANSNARQGIFIWSPQEDVSCDTCNSTEVFPTEELIIQVKVIDENGCEAWADIVIKVKITKRVWAPNVFTPDGDRLNDGFTLFGNATLQTIEALSIFDRWGEQVFFKENFEPGIPELGWDGLLNGTAMNPAVFAWVARVRFVDGEVRTLSGDVTLIR